LALDNDGVVWAGLASGVATQQLDTTITYSFGDSNCVVNGNFTLGGYGWTGDTTGINSGRANIKQPPNVAPFDLYQDISSTGLVQGDSVVVSYVLLNYLPTDTLAFPGPSAGVNLYFPTSGDPFGATRTAAGHYYDTLTVGTFEEIHFLVSGDSPGTDTTYVAIDSVAIYFIVPDTSTSVTGVSSVDTSFTRGVLDIASDDSSNIWVATEDGILKLPNGSWSNRIAYADTNSYVLNNTVTRIIHDPVRGVWAGHAGFDTLYVSSVGLALYGTSPGDSAYVNHTDSLPGTTIYALAMDSSNNLWAGTDSGASVYMGVWFNYDTSDGLPDNRVMAIAVDDSGYTWFGTPQGAVRFDGDTTWTDVSDSIDAHAGRNVFAIGIDQKQYIIWFATDEGIASYKPSTLYPYSPYSGYTYSSSEGNLPTDLVNDIVVDADTTVWIATPKGLVRLKEVRE
jgi:hypothetical protein